MLLFVIDVRIFDVDACDDHLISITKLNDEVASLNAQLKTCKINFDKLKFAREPRTKQTKGLPFPTRRKGRLLWLVILKGTMLLCMIGKLLIVLIIIGVIIMMLLIHMLCLPLVLLLFMVEVGLGEIMLCIMCQGKCAMNLLLFSMLATLLLFFHVRMQK
jgi:hypothetical protein